MRKIRILFCKIVASLRRSLTTLESFDIMYNFWKAIAIVIVYFVPLKFGRSKYLHGLGGRYETHLCVSHPLEAEYQCVLPVVARSGRPIHE